MYKCMNFLKINISSRIIVLGYNISKFPVGAATELKIKCKLLESTKISRGLWQCWEIQRGSGGLYLYFPGEIAAVKIFRGGGFWSAADKRKCHSMTFL